jgi:hypothetical protein
MKSSKLTTICGIIAGASSVVATYNFTPLITKISSCVAAVATSVGLILARDNKVSDEQAGANLPKSN